MPPNTDNSNNKKMLSATLDRENRGIRVAISCSLLVTINYSLINRSCGIRSNEVSLNYSKRVAMRNQDDNYYTQRDDANTTLRNVASAALAVENSA